MPKLGKCSDNFADLFVVPPGSHFGDENLLGVVDHLFAHHDDGELLSKFYQTTTIAALKG